MKSKGNLIFAFLLLGLFFIKNPGFSLTGTSGITLESNPRGIAVNPATEIAVIANEQSDSVSIVNLATLQVIDTIPVGKAPRSVAIDIGRNTAVITNSHDDTLTVMDLNSNQISATIPVGKFPTGVAVDQSTHTAFVANHQDNTATAVNLITYSPIATIHVGQEPSDIAVDPELGLALVTNEKDNSISIIDLTTHQVIATIAVGQKPPAVDINPETHFAAVVNEKDNSITVINLLNRQTADVPVGKHPIEVAVNTLDNRGLVICDEDRSLVLVDLNTGALLKSYPLEKLPRGVSVNNFTNMAAVADVKTDSLTLIELPNPVPVITSITPPALLRGTSTTKVTIQGSGFIKSSTVRLQNTGNALSVDFVDNHTIEADIPEALLQNTGTYQIAVTNPSPDGGSSNPYELTIINPLPQILSFDPQETIAGSQGLTLSIYGTGFFNDSTVYINGVSRPFTRISLAKIQMALTAQDLETGAYLKLTAFNPAPGGGLSSLATLTVKNPVPELASINPSSIMAGSPDFTLILTGNNFVKTSSISFNNKQYAAKFISKTQVEASIPSDAITTTGDYPVTMVNPAPGGGESTSLTFTVSPPVELTANITNGIPSFTTYFTVYAGIPDPITGYEMDFEGDGVIDYSGQTFENISRTYTTEGDYHPTVVITDSKGNKYRASMTITVFSKTEVDAQIKEKWEGMKAKLASQDVEGAVGYFNSTSRDRYREIFTALNSILPDIATNMQDIQLIYLYNGIAKYRMRKNEIYGGQSMTITYYIYFLIDDKGRWSIDKF